MNGNWIVPVQLRFADADAPRPAVLATGAAGVHNWRTDDGGFIASISPTDGAYRMTRPGLATYCFAPNDPFITAFPDPGVRYDLVAAEFSRTVLPMAMQALGYEALHASALVHISKGVIVLAGRSLEGKSTLAFGLSAQAAQAARSYPIAPRQPTLRQWADAGVVWRTEIAASRVAATAMPLPFKPRLRAASTEMIRTLPAIVAAPPANGQTASDAVEPFRPTPIGAICLLERSDAEWPGQTAASLTRLREAEAFSSVLAHAYELDPFDKGRRAALLRAYLELVAAVPVFILRFRSGAEHLAAVLETVAHELETQRRGASLCAPLSRR